MLSAGGEMEYTWFSYFPDRRCIMLLWYSDGVGDVSIMVTEGICERVVEV